MMSNKNKKIPPKVPPKPKKKCKDFATLICESDNPDYLATSDKVPTSIQTLYKDQDHGLQSIYSESHANNNRFKLGVGLYTVCFFEGENYNVHHRQSKKYFWTKQLVSFFT